MEVALPLHFQCYLTSLSPPPPPLLYGALRVEGLPGREFSGDLNFVAPQCLFVIVLPRVSSCCFCIFWYEPSSRSQISFFFLRSRTLASAAESPSVSKTCAASWNHVSDPLSVCSSVLYAPDSFPRRPAPPRVERGGGVEEVEGGG